MGKKNLKCCSHFQGPCRITVLTVDSFISYQHSPLRQWTSACCAPYETLDAERAASILDVNIVSIMAVQLTQHHLPKAQKLVLCCVTWPRGWAFVQCNSADTDTEFPKLWKTYFFVRSGPRWNIAVAYWYLCACHLRSTCRRKRLRM